MHSLVVDPHRRQEVFPWLPFIRVLAGQVHLEIAEGAPEESCQRRLLKGRAEPYFNNLAMLHSWSMLPTFSVVLAPNGT